MGTITALSISRSARRSDCRLSLNYCAPPFVAGGIYQLRQGQQRRIQVRVKPVQNSGTLPIICQSILNIAVGSVSVRNRLQIPLDSYQDEDLSILREKWSDALMRRRQYLDQQIQKLINKQGNVSGTCFAENLRRCYTAISSNSRLLRV